VLERGKEGRRKNRFEEGGPLYVLWGEDERKTRLFCRKERTRVGDHHKRKGKILDSDGGSKKVHLRR